MSSMRYYEGRGATFLDPVPRPGAVGLVSFMPPALADGVLVELAQTTGYEFPEAETDGVEEAPAPVIHTPILRGAAGYTRHGLVSGSTWGQVVRAPEEDAAGKPPEASAPVIHTPILRGAAGYTRHGLSGA